MRVGDYSLNIKIILHKKIHIFIYIITYFNKIEKTFLFWYQSCSLTVIINNKVLTLMDF